MKKILVTGANGLLGQKLVERLAVMPDVQLLATGKGIKRHPDQFQYASMDVTVQQEVDAIFDRFRPDVLIHTAAMTQVDDCQLQQATCYTQNVTPVECLMRAAERFQTHFIHLSTDFIFDGEAGPYKEEDTPNPLSYYGYCKLEAEKKLIQCTSPWTIVRTILVFGLLKDTGRSNIVLWVKSNLLQNKPIRVVTDQFRTPTLAEDLADGCIRLALSGKQGIYHIAGPDFMSIYELACRVAEFFHLPKHLIQPVDSATINQPAKRPPRSGLCIDKAIQELGYAPHTFEQALRLMQEQEMG